MGLGLKKCTWIKHATLFILFLLFFLYGFWLRGIAAECEAAVWRKIFLTPEPDLCALCGYGTRYHAPCLVSLSTGEMGGDANLRSGPRV